MTARDQKATLSEPMESVSFRGLSRRIQRRSGHRIIDVSLWGQSGRVRNSPNRSAHSQEATFFGALEVQNRPIEWLQRRCSFLGDEPVVRFPRVWMSSGECRINRLGHKMSAFDPAKQFIQRRLATFKKIPPRTPSASSNANGFARKQSRSMDSPSNGRPHRVTPTSSHRP